MGSNKSKLAPKVVQNFTGKVIESSSSKAEWILEWYKVEQEHHKRCGESHPKLELNLERCYSMLSDGRRIGKLEIDKLLLVTSPIHKLAKKSNVSPALKFLLSVIFSALELENHLKFAEVRLFAQNLFDQVSQTKSQFSVKTMRCIATFAASVKRLIVSQGRSFEEDPVRVTLPQLQCWSRWILIHLLLHLVTNLVFRPDTFDPSDYIHRIVVLARDYLSDFNQLCLVLRHHHLSGQFRLELTEQSYMTQPAQGQQRWWIDAKVCLTQSQPFFKSQNHKFAQVCLTRGFPKSSDYERGLLNYEEYQQAWDCLAYCEQHDLACDVIEPGPQCVKCSFVKLWVVDKFQGFEEILQELSSGEEAVTEVVSGLKRFQIIL